MTRYDRLPKPERQARIDVRERPALIARAAYFQWLAYERRSGIETKEPTEWYKRKQGNPALCEELYQAAVQMLKPYAKAFRDVKPQELEAIITTVDPRYNSATGLFLSALHNATDLRVLDGVFAHDILGYKLAPGKTLITRPGSRSESLGKEAQGTLIHFGDTAARMADDAIAGIQANFGSSVFFASCSNGGVQLNAALTEHFAPMATGGIQVDLGTTKYSRAWDADDAVVIAGNLLIVPDDCMHGGGTAYCGPKRHEVSEAIEAHRFRFDEVERLAEDYQRTKNASPVIAYDWPSFTDDMLSLKRSIKQVFQ